jgi:S-methylmethionine-dependent homocysteine/selenocysteine methylase
MEPSCASISLTSCSTETDHGKVGSDTSPSTSDFQHSAQELRVMDGSMGHLCILRGVPQDERLWSARGLVEEKYHDIVVKAHVDYIKAGATMITTNNYAVQPNYYSKVYPDDWQARIEADTKKAVELAVKARAECCAENSVRIMGCLPPICQTYRPDLTEKFIEEQGENACMWYYKTIGKALLEAGVDGFIAETMNSWEEAQMTITVAKELRTPIVVCMEGSLRGADLLPKPHLAPIVASQVLKAKENGAPIEAFGLNCAAPEHILASLQAIQSSGVGQRLKEAGIHLAAYANCNDTSKLREEGFDLKKAAKLKPSCRRRDLVGSKYARFCREFSRAGAHYCGGCCGTTPDEIREIAALGEDSDEWELTTDKIQEPAEVAQGPR